VSLTKKGERKMNIWALPALFTFITAFFLGSFNYCKSPKKMLNRIFLFNSSTVFLMSFAEFHFLQSETFKAASFWIRIYDSWPLVLFSHFIFILALTKNSKLLKNIFVYILIGIPMVIALILMQTLLIRTPVRVFWVECRLF
jgi:hypothetical protein